MDSVIIMEERKQDYIIGVLVVIILFILGFLGVSYFRSEPAETDDGTPDVAIEVVDGRSRSLFEGYITEISPITGEMKVMVGLDMFVNYPEATKEITVKIDPNTAFRILSLPEELDGTDYQESPASFEDLRVLDDVAIAMAGDIREILRDEPIIARRVTKLD